MYKIATGTNSERKMWKGCNYGRHAETEAMLRLPPSYGGKGRKRTDWINLLVIRIDKSKNLKDSKPCSKCLEHLSKMKNYKLRFVYYSDSEGNIVKRKFADLLLEENKHVSRRFKDDHPANKARKQQQHH